MLILPLACTICREKATQASRSRSEGNQTLTVWWHKWRNTSFSWMEKQHRAETAKSLNKIIFCFCNSSKDGLWQNIYRTAPSNIFPSLSVQFVEHILTTVFGNSQRKTELLEHLPFTKERESHNSNFASWWAKMGTKTSFAYAKSTYIAVNRVNGYISQVRHVPISNRVSLWEFHRFYGCLWNALPDDWLQYF